jgi:hypothetical protein
MFVSYIAVIAVAALLLLVIVMLARRSRPDTAGDFRRQINALSSEARRPVVEQVHNLEKHSEKHSDSHSDSHSEAPTSPDSSEAGEADHTNGS